MKRIHNMDDTVLIKTVNDVINGLKFTEVGLIPAIAQQFDSHEVLMLAWMNQDSINLTLRKKQVHYWSRSRNAIWRKGETSGHTQKLIELRIDCDSDSILLLVDQTGPACHTNRRTCFFKSFSNNGLKNFLEPLD